MINGVFQGCVGLLQWLAKLTGTTYEQINVYIFCLIGPALICVLLAYCYYQHRRIRALLQAPDVEFVLEEPTDAERPVCKDS